MGGSILGMKAIYNFLEKKIRNKIYFVDNLDIKIKDKSTKPVNIIISKSGNTLETIANSNLIIKKNKKNIFITEKKNSYLRELAIKLKAEIVDQPIHAQNDFWRCDLPVFRGDDPTLTLALQTSNRGVFVDGQPVGPQSLSKTAHV